MKNKTISKVVNKCPKCENRKITMNFDHNLKKYTIECIKCNKKYILPQHSTTTCPICGGKKFIHERYESYCFNCGLVLTGTYNYVAGIKIVYPWGLRF